MLIGLAVRVGTAGHVVAGIDATSVNARQVIFAIVVRRALALAGRDSCAAGAVRIANHALGALAHVISLRVDAVRAVTAGVIRTFVHVDAAVLRVALETGLAHASRWIARRASRVDTARETVAGICVTIEMY